MLSDLPLDSTSSGMPCVTAGASEVWDDAMKVISRKLSAQNYDLWFRPIVCQRVDGQNIYLTAPNQFIKEWFETHYQQVVMEVIHEGSTRPYVIHWQIDESSSQAESDADATVRKAKTAKASAPPSSPADSD
jgi:chromosomal replication initiator protein